VRDIYREREREREREAAAINAAHAGYIGLCGERERERERERIDI
jgi:hypothetical protein